VLFNNAGLFGQPGPLEELPLDAWRQWSTPT
jgi:NAD(P)-dependent dehydrogenase (short-subunit alcohol dehydrogenase family)